MDSISLGLISLVDPGKGTPSSTIRGVVLALMELRPRTWSVAVVPGADEVCVTVKPGTEPSTASITLVTGSSESRDFGIEATEPVTSDRFWVP